MLDVVKVLSDLISFPSVNDPVRGIKPSYDIVKYIYEFLSNYGIDVSILEFNGYYSIFGSVGDGEPYVMLLAHYDVVPADVSRWSYDPFKPTLANDRLYGRGALDDKSNVAAMMVALAELSKLRLNRKVLYAFTGDEEVGGEYGALQIVKKLVSDGLLPKYFLVECRLWRSITKAKDSLGLIVQAPGYCSLLKREFIELVGGWEDLLTEDNDLTLRIYGVGGRIKLVGAEVYIESPTKVLTLIKQRVRWYRGTLEVLIRRWGVLSRLGLKLRIDAFMTYTSPITPALLIPALISNTLLGGPFNLINAILVIPQVLTPLMISDLDIISRIKLSIITLPYVIINSIASIIAITTLVLGIRISWWRTEKLGVRCFIN